MKSLWRRKWQPTPVFLPGESRGQRSLAGCSPWGRTESDMTERLHFHFSLSCIGEGNDNPLQYSCLENPRDRGAWWAAIYGVAQSQHDRSDLAAAAAAATYINLEELMLGKINQSQKDQFFVATAAKSLQSCLTLCDPIEGSPTGSPSLGFSRQEHWSGLPFPSPVHESEK